MILWQRLCVAVLVFCSWPLPAQSGPKESESLLFTIVGLEETGGRVYCALYGSAEGFPDEPKKSIQQVVARPKNKKALCVFRGLEPGQYAVAVWHDVDDDKELDSNFLGIPSEPVGASNNAKGRFGPPRFEDAAFSFRTTAVRQTVRVE